MPRPLHSRDPSPPVRDGAWDRAQCRFGEHCSEGERMWRRSSLRVSTAASLTPLKFSNHMPTVASLVTLARMYCLPLASAPQPD